MKRLGADLLRAASLALLSIQLVLDGSARTLPKVRVAPNGNGFATTDGRPFVPFGVTYYRPGTGWAPQVWKQFDAAATRRDFQRMKGLGVNCVRVFLSFGSFYHQLGELDTNGLAKFDEFLSIAESAGIYVHPTGPDLWEGAPDFPLGGIGDEKTLLALEKFWTAFAGRYRGRNVIFSYDLLNEPSVEWQAAADAADPAPSLAAKTGDAPLLKFQSYREHLADEWTRRQVAAIKAADPGALVTVGMIQWSVPSLLPGSVEHYSGFRPSRQASFLDYMTIHFYPLADGGYKYRDAASETRNLAYLESVVRYAKQPGKPLVLGEFGWYGGTEKPRFNHGEFPAASQEQQAAYDSKVVETSAPFACGWLNWGFYDQPEANDCSEQTGLATANGQTKAWGRSFHALSNRLRRHGVRPKSTGPRPELDWDACLSSIAAEKQFLDDYTAAFTSHP
jgi:endo-1,4-beta-mannosidase